MLHEFASTAKLSESEEREETAEVIQWPATAKLQSRSKTLKIRPTDITEPSKILTFSEVCKRGAFRIKPTKEETGILTDMTRCQEPQSYHAQTTMTDR